jgi:AraC-like DNA-binding protein
MRVRHEDGIEDFHAGEFCFIQPNTFHVLEGITDTVTPFAHFDIFYQANRKQSFPTKAGQIDLSLFETYLQPKLNDLENISIPLRLQPKDVSAFKNLFLQMVTSWNRNKSASNLEAQGLGTSLIQLLISDHIQKNNMPPTQQRLDWMNAYIQLHLSSPLTIEQMAKRANLSPSRFRTIFKEEFGRSPHQHILHLRLEHAIYLLKNTQQSIESIANYCGFSDIHHFSKTFKTHYSISPNQYRHKK